MSAFYDLRATAPTDPADLALLQHEGDVDRERQLVEHAHRRDDERALRRALARLHMVEAAR